MRATWQWLSTEGLLHRCWKVGSGSAQAKSQPHLQRGGHRGGAPLHQFVIPARYTSCISDMLSAVVQRGLQHSEALVINIIESLLRCARTEQETSANAREVPCESATGRIGC